jgi:DNA gyrase subunit A
VKKTNLSDFANVRKGGIIAIQIEEGDELIDALLTNGMDEVVLITRKGMSIRFHEEEARDMGRNAVGTALGNALDSTSIAFSPGEAKGSSP